MKSPYLKKIVIETVCLLYILLFVYAAVSKLLDFKNFQVQLGQSPMLSAFAGIISVVVPVIELVIVSMIAIRSTQRFGLYAGFALMVMFSAYIFILLNYGSYIPCSCGGILNKLGWKEHLIFNIVVALLPIPALLWQNECPRLTSRIFILSVITLISISVVYGLFRRSEIIIHYQNNFTRRFPQHPAQESDILNLGYNSYYFAGTSEGKIYLGNSTAPLHVLSVDTVRHQIQRHIIQLNEDKLPFRSVQVRVKDGSFYIVDGTIPILYKGTIKDWNASLLQYTGLRFSQLSPLDNNHLAVRAIDSMSGENRIVIIGEKEHSIVSRADNFLSKQIDGIFDTDGVLLTDPVEGNFTYLYRYRNEFITSDKNFSAVHHSRTIDTISKAKLHLEEIHSKKEVKMSAPPLTVNRSGSVYKGVLFVNSAIPGKYEDLKMWDQASIIDVYTVEDPKYVLSFYISNLKNYKMKQILVYGASAYVLIDNSLIQYKLTPKITNNYSKEK